jgi:flagellar protein FliS
MKRKLSTYQQIDTEGKSQLELVIKIFDGALQSLTAAKEAYAKEEHQTGYKDLEKVRRFVVHLYSTLDFVKGGDVADQLGKLYVFMMSEIDLIEATKDTARIESCAKVLRNLRDGWTGLRPVATPIPAVAATSERDRVDSSVLVTA